MWVAIGWLSTGLGVAQGWLETASAFFILHSAFADLLPMKEYEELLERVEDAHDLAWLKRARKKPLHYRPPEDHLAERKRK